MSSRNGKMIRVGVVGVGRGSSFAHSASEHLGLKLVALCDTWKERLDEVGKKYKVATYTEFDRFLEHDMDAVVLANYFHEHAPLAIKALRAGLHVMSETGACKTLAEGVALCREVEKSKRIYMFAENYPFTQFNLEMRRLYQAGEIGRVLYAEGEYNHPMSPDDRERLSPGRFALAALPALDVLLHARAGALVNVTGEMPVSVIGLSVAAPELDKDSARVGDPDVGHPLPHGRRRGLPPVRPGHAGPQLLVPLPRHARRDGVRARHARLLRHRPRPRVARRVGRQTPRGARAHLRP